MAWPGTVMAKCGAYCLPLNLFLCMPSMLLWESPYLRHGFACHRRRKMLDVLFAFQLFLCMPSTILWESPYLSHGFACHRHGKIRGLLPAFPSLSLHTRQGAMGVTVIESWLCLSPSRRLAGPIACLSIFVSLHPRHNPMGLTVLEPWLCLPGFACHRHEEMLGLLSLPFNQRLLFAFQARY